MIYYEFQFEQQIEEYTRVVITEKGEVSHKSRTLIGRFAANRPNYIGRVSVLKLEVVDHYLIFEVRKMNARRSIDKQAKMVETRGLKSYNKQLFLNEVSTIDWCNTLDCSRLSR